jgi:hypothetical protein
LLSIFYFGEITFACALSRKLTHLTVNQMTRPNSPVTVTMLLELAQEKVKKYTIRFSRYYGNGNN